MYLFQLILTSRFGEYTADILQQIIPFMKAGAKIIVRDGDPPEPGDWPSSDEQYIMCIKLLTSDISRSSKR